jgi:hypothetical protein
MAICESPDFLYPMQADIFYPIVDQGVYGNVKKQWILDRTFVCNFNSAGSAGKEDITPNIQIKQELLLIGRSKTDPRISAREEKNSMTNVVISNLKDRNCNPVYVETAGPRIGKSTIFEIATVEPILGPFGSVDYYKLVIRRSENQAVDI